MSSPIPQTTPANYYPQAQYAAASTSAANPIMTTTPQYMPSTTGTQYIAHYATNVSTPNPATGTYGSYGTAAYSFPTTYNAAYAPGTPGLPAIPGTASLGNASNLAGGNPNTGTHKTSTGTLRPSSPVAPTVTAREASQAVQRLAASELKEAGFSGAQPEALYVLEQEVVGFVQSLYTLAHRYSNLSNRSGPIATDLLLATEDLDKEWAYDVSPEKLAKWQRKRERRKAAKDAKGKRNASTAEREKKSFSPAPSLVPHPTRTPTPELLPSDDEMDVDDMVSTAVPAVTSAVLPSHQMSQIPPTAHPTHLSLVPPSLTLQPGGPGTIAGVGTKVRPIPASTLRNLPGNLPGLPPKHTYLQTPVTTRRNLSQHTSSSSDPAKPKSQNQLQMEKKLRTAALVQESLKNLLLATEYTEDTEFDSGGVSGATARENAELLGHIVNWESTVGVGRKRWRV
ncbi:hypothetical protein FB446DRAFT_751252 [Lentinula raphanica]|nr:hypothetical protein FB446DRAFT_751252 [Lentinula raphanica]